MAALYFAIIKRKGLDKSNLSGAELAKIADAVIYEKAVGEDSSKPAYILTGAYYDLKVDTLSTSLLNIT